MIRARFITTSEDYRPVTWPLKHPYWCSGVGDGYSTIVAFADDVTEIKRLWPEAEDIDHCDVDDYCFTDRFPKPLWWTAP
jgi:hypothetical protein